MNDEDTGIIIETVSLGNSLKVTAIDPATGREASIVADPRTPEILRERLAVRKLRYVQAKLKAARKAKTPNLKTPEEDNLY